MRENQTSPSEKVGKLLNLKFLFLLGLDLIVGEVVEAKFKLDDKSPLESVASPFAGDGV